MLYLLVRRSTKCAIYLSSIFTESGKIKTQNYPANSISEDEENGSIECGGGQKGAVLLLLVGDDGVGPTI